MLYVDEVGGGPEAAERLFIQALLLLRRLPHLMLASVPQCACTIV